MKITFAVIPEPKVAETDLYARGKKIKFYINGELCFLIDHSQPRRGHDYLRVTKGDLYYEWIDKNGNRTIDDKTRFDEMLKIHHIEDDMF